MKKLYRPVSALLCLALAACLLGGCAASPAIPAASQSGAASASPSASDPADSGVSPSPSPSAAALPATAESYAAIFGALTQAQTRSQSAGYGGVMADGKAEMAAEAPAAAPAPDAAAGESAAAMDSGTVSAGSDYSGTNVQVDGVDEGDIVKTDGEYLYILHNYDVLIARADGAGTEVIATITVGDQSDSYDSEDDDQRSEGSSKYPSELYISGDRMAVISSYNSWLQYKQADDSWYYDDTSYCAVDIYDISDPENPSLLTSLGQDGYELSSRVMDGTLYLLTNYYVYNWEEKDPYTFVPCLYAKGEAVAVDAGDICIMPDLYDTQYVVISTYDLESGQLLDNLDILGGGQTVYMNESNLYLAGTRSEQTASEPYTQSVYTVVDYEDRTVTDITRLSLEGGLSVAASGTVEGYLNNQFSMDEYDGCLRLVTTLSGSNYSTYTDEDFDFVNYKYGDYESTNSLYVLDDGLNRVGGVEDLAEGEYIYSARFDGPFGYFCTYRSVDPLFAVDLTDPGNPVILSELKITGFSEYLHLWDEDLLFGLGQEADEDTGMTQGLKLVMFDTSDKAGVYDKDVYNLDDANWSEALYNHKAILISPEKNLIAFPADDDYYIFGYDDGGFFEKAVVDLGESWYSGGRGLYIGDYVYIVSGDRISVLDMSDFGIIAKVDLPVSEIPYAIAY